MNLIITYFNASCKRSIYLSLSSYRNISAQMTNKVDSGLTFNRNRQEEAINYTFDSILNKDAMALDTGAC